MVVSTMSDKWIFGLFQVQSCNIFHRKTLSDWCYSIYLFGWNVFCSVNYRNNWDKFSHLSRKTMVKFCNMEIYKSFFTLSNNVKSHRPSQWPCYFFSTTSMSEVQRISHFVDRMPINTKSAIKIILKLSNANYIKNYDWLTEMAFFKLNHWPCAKIFSAEFLIDIKLVLNLRSISDLL